MSVRVWRTGEPREASFDAAWGAALARAPFAHFALRLDWLEWNAALGTPGIAVLVEEPGTTGVIAARLERGVWVSGLPWRWQAAVVCEGRGPAGHLEPREAKALFLALARAVGGERVRVYLPVPPASGIPGYLAGKTILHRVDVGDEELRHAMDKTKRSMIRRAGRDGYEVEEGTTLELMRGFAAVQRQTDERHGLVPQDGPGMEPGPGLRWREWELPWMWLLVAKRAGEVGSGFGFALGSGSVLESRAAGSTREALRSGAFVLLAFEAARRARERGYRWLNWGGDTFFKRDVSGVLGERVPLHVWLGGSGLWAVANRSEALAVGARRFAGGLRRGAPDGAEPEEHGAPVGDEPRPRRPRGAKRVAAPAGPRVSVWRTHERLEEAFAVPWAERLSGSHHANFSLDARHLAHEAAAGRRAIAVQAEEGARRAALVLREEGGALVCGWPWRWQAVLDGRNAGDPRGMSAEDAEWLFGVARSVAAGRPLRVHLPHAPADGTPWFVAGATILQPLQRTDDEIHASIAPAKRRMIRRARELGYEVAEATCEAEFREFHALQRAVAASRGRADRGSGSSGPDAWREWELPWMWLHVARRDGRIVAGCGDGVFPGGVADGRAGAVTPEARRDGVFALVCWEEVRRARDRGYRWLNHGGDTVFKREMAGTLGTRVAVSCWLGGAGASAVLHRAEAALRRLRPHVGAMLRARGVLRGLPATLGTLASQAPVEECAAWML